MRFTNTAYDGLKSLVIITFPLLSSLLFVSSYIWYLPSTKTIMGMIALLTLVISICLIISTKRYKNNEIAYDGQIVVVIQEDGPKSFMLELNGDPEDLEQKDFVTFKIAPTKPSGKESL